MKKLIILPATILLVLLPVIAVIGCQQQSELPPSPPIPTPLPPKPEQEYVPTEIIVMFKPGTPIEVQEQLHQKLGTTVSHISPSAGFQVLQIPKGKTVPEMVALYSEQSIVEYAEPNYIERILPESK